MNLVLVARVKNISNVMVHLANESLPHVDVVVAIVTNQSGDVLVARRATHKHQGGLWEFPGGKVECGEGIEAALKREIYEELGITIEEAKPFMQQTHCYPDKRITLHVWSVTRFSGEAYGKENQPIAWINKTDLPTLEFPAANQAILQKFLAN
jgi:8-oxo-dGTP diphosphatase